MRENMGRGRKCGYYCGKKATCLSVTELRSCQECADQVAQRLSANNPSSPGVISPDDLPKGRVPGQLATVSGGSIRGRDAVSVSTRANMMGIAPGTWRAA